MTNQYADDRRTYHGNIRPDDFANALIAEFHHGNLVGRKIGSGEKLVVQLATHDMATSGGRTSLSIHMTHIEDGVLVELGDQEWFGIAASLGKSALAALHNPLSLLSRLDDIAQDITSLQMKQRIWETIERTAASLGASTLLSERLRRLTCPYCLSANPVGESSCDACGAPLGMYQPLACQKCGFVARAADVYCPQCGTPLHS